jgi:cation transport regulator ChaB
MHELPEPIRNALPRAAQDVFRSAYNRAAQGGASESKAMGYAWVAVKNGWKKNGNEQKWVRKKVLQNSNNDLTNAIQSDIDTHNSVEKAEYQGRQVTLDKPFRTPGESKKFAVYVKDGDTVKIVRFGDPDMEIRRDDAEARANFRARHSCDTATDKTSARYWSCRMWEKGQSVSDVTKIVSTSEVCKVDESLGLVFGYAMVSKIDGEPHFDLQGHHIPEATVVRVLAKFMEDGAIAKEMHSGEPVGKYVFAFPLTTDIADSLDILPMQTGAIVAMKPDNPDILKKFANGEYTGFSIGGINPVFEDYDDEA